ncbi:MAG: hypothetical protein QOI17_182 [Gaiellales bacterium]|nr:hypothetical protein [Gaiellales bacterium]
MIRARFSADAPQAEVLAALTLVTGARAGLSVEQIDDLVMALELLVRRQPLQARSVSFLAGDDGLDVSVSDVDGDWLEQRRAMLAVLVSDLADDAAGVRLRVSA